MEKHMQAADKKAREREQRADKERKVMEMHMQAKLKKKAREREETQMNKSGELQAQVDRAEARVDGPDDFLWLVAKTVLPILRFL